MALGIVEPKSDASPPGTELLVDNDQTGAGHSNLKHGVRHPYDSWNRHLLTLSTETPHYFGTATF